MQSPPLRPRRVATVCLVLLALLAVSCVVTTDSLENVTMSDGTPAIERSDQPATTPAESATPEPQDSAPDASGSETPPAEDPSSGEADADGQAAPNVGLSDPATIGSDGAGDAYYPTYGNGGYDVEAYDLVLDWDDESREINGDAFIALVATQPLSQFNLDLVGLTVSKITVNDETATFERDGRELIIRPATPLELDEPAVVAVSYSGRPMPIPGVAVELSWGWTDLGDAIIVAGEPEGAAGWYPVNAHPSDKATYRIEITAASDLVVAANGTQTSVTDNGDTTTWVYESASPQAHYLTTLAIGDFVFYDGADSASGVPVRHYFQPGVFDRSVATMERTGEMIDAFEERFGPYPFENYGTVVVDDALRFALETQTLSVFGVDFLSESVVAHELAHQWFGNHVSVGQWSDIWLNEGFANYGEYLWREASVPGFDIDAAVRSDYDDIGSSLRVPPGAPPPNDLFNASVYYRGGFTLHALRTTIGDDAFFQLLATYVDEYGGGNASTDDFISLAEAISGQDLEEFFDGWLYSSQIPPLPR